MTAAPTQPATPYLRLAMDDSQPPAPNLVHPSPQAAAGAVSGPLRYLRAIGAATRGGRLRAAQAGVLRAMLEYLDFSTGETWAAAATIGASADLSEDGAGRILGELQDAGVVEIVERAVGRRSALRRICLEVLEAAPNTAAVDPIPDRVYENPSARRPDPRSGQRPAVDPIPDRVKPVDPIGAPRRPDPRSGNHTDQKAAAAAAAASSNAGAQTPEQTRPPAAGGFASTALGRELLAELREAGMRPADAQALAERPDFDQDLAVYLLSRVKDIQPRHADGVTEKRMAVANRRAGLARTLSAQPRENLTDFGGFTRRRHQIRAAGINAVMDWQSRQRPTSNAAMDFELDAQLVSDWLTARGVIGKPAEDWSAVLGVPDTVFVATQSSDHHRGQAWGAIVAFCRSNP